MKKILRTVLTKEYLSRALLIIIVFSFLTWLSRGSICRALYMIVFECWSLAFLYVRLDYENDL